MSKLVTMSDGSQYIVFSEVQSDVHVSLGGLKPVSEEDIELSEDEAIDLAQKLTTHRAKFDTMSKEIKLTKKPSKAQQSKQETPPSAATSDTGTDQAPPTNKA